MRERWKRNVPDFPRLWSLCTCWWSAPSLPPRHQPPSSPLALLQNSTVRLSHPGGLSSALLPTLPSPSSLAKDLPVIALKSIFITHISSCSAHIHTGLKKIVHPLSCNCTKDHSFTSLHNQPPPTLVLRKLHSNALKLKQPVPKHSSPSHTNTAAAGEAIPAGRRLRHSETGVGDVQR